MERILYNLKEAAEMLSVSTQTVTSLVNAGTLKAVDMSSPGSLKRTLRFTKEDLEAFVRGGR